MKKLLFPLLLVMAFTLAACSDDELPAPNLEFKVEGAADGQMLEVAQEDTLKITVVVTNAQPCLFSWQINGREMGNFTTYRFTSKTVGDHQLTLTATNLDGVKTTQSFKIHVYGKYRNGTFVLNEGNMSKGNGFLSFINRRNEISDSVYFKANGTELGNAAEDLFIANKRMYIICQNGNRNGGDGKLVVADAETLEKVAAYNEELAALSWPTHVAVNDEMVYIRDNNGIHRFDEKNRELVLVEGTKGAANNNMAVVSDKVFAFNGNKLMTVKGDRLINTLELDGKISGIQKAGENTLWVACNTTPAQLYKINALSYKVIQKNTIEEAGLSAGWGTTPAFTAKGDTIYFNNNSTKIYRHVFSRKQTQLMTDVKEHIADAAMNYNNPAVHPVTGDVYFTSIKGFGEDYKINSIAVFNFNEKPVLKYNYQNHTAFPAGVFFTDSFQ